MSILREAKTEVIKTDVLVLGGGIAACHAAIKAKESGLDVLMVDKGNIGRSGFSPMMSGVLTYFDPEKDNYDQWYRECVEAGEGLVDQKRLDGLIYQTHDRIRAMDSWGVTFQKERGEFVRKPCVGHVYGRNVLMTNGGLQLMSVVSGEAVRCGVRVINRVMVTDLLSSDGEFKTSGRIVGAVGFNVKSGKFYVFKGKATVIATGATSSIQHGPSLAVHSGDGQAMAFRAGCEIRNSELCFHSPHPASLNCAPGLNIFVAEGARFVNARGERFMPKWDPVRAERAPRAVVARAIATEEFEGRGPVYLDATHLGNGAYQRIEKCIPLVLASFTAKGFDIGKDRIPYTVALSDIGPGGIRVDREYRTAIPGLYAGGAVSDHAEDGVSNVISQGITSLIEGYLAGESAAKYAAEIEEPTIHERQVQLMREQIFLPMKRKAGPRHSQIRQHCKSMIGKGLLGPIKNEKGLKEAIDIAQEIREKEIPRLVATDYHELARTLGLRNELLYLELYAKCSLLRTESRGSHIRADYPERDDAHWLKWVIAKMEADGIKAWVEPIPIEEYPVKPQLI